MYIPKTTILNKPLDAIQNVVDATSLGNKKLSGKKTYIRTYYVTIYKTTWFHSSPSRKKSIDIYRKTVGKYHRNENAPRELCFIWNNEPLREYWQWINDRIDDYSIPIRKALARRLRNQIGIRIAKAARWGETFGSRIKKTAKNNSDTKYVNAYIRWYHETLIPRTGPIQNQDGIEYINILKTVSDETLELRFTRSFIDFIEPSKYTFLSFHIFDLLKWLYFHRYTQLLLERYQNWLEFYGSASSTNKSKEYTQSIVIDFSNNKGDTQLDYSRKTIRLLFFRNKI